MATPPAGTITLLFTDLEGSTQLLRQFGVRYGDVLTEYRTLLRSIFTQYGGHEVDTQGDSFFVAFADPCGALGPPPTRRSRSSGIRGRAAQPSGFAWAYTRATRWSPTATTSASTSTAERASPPPLTEGRRWSPSARGRSSPTTQRPVPSATSVRIA